MSQKIRDSSKRTKIFHQYILVFNITQRNREILKSYGKACLFCGRMEKTMKIKGFNI